MKEKIVGIISAMLILLFVYTGFSKFFNMEDFTGTMRNQPIPHQLAPFLAWFFPTAEIAAAACLLFDRSRRPGLYICLSLLTIFTLYIAAILLHFFHKIPCSCGGIFRWLSWQQHLWLNLFFIAITVLALILKTAKSIHSPLNLQL
jgi:putative oxidoreductase